MQLCAMLSSREYDPCIKLTNGSRLMILKCMPVDLSEVQVSNIAAWADSLPSARAGARSSSDVVRSLQGSFWQNHTRQIARH